MLFFSRILKLKQEKIALREQRLSERYAVGSRFPLQVVLDVAGRETRSSAANLSANGIGIATLDGAVGKSGEGCTCRLEIERHRLDLPGQIVHSREVDGQALYGVALRFGDFATKMAYMQLLEAVILGATLAPASASQAPEDASWLRREQYRGEGNGVLTVWRETESRAIDSFEFQLDEYFVRGHSKVSRLEFYTQEHVKDLHKSGYSAPALRQHDDANEEVGRLFRWVVPNVSRQVPDDVYSFLSCFLPPVPSAAVSADVTGT